MSDWLSDRDEETAEKKDHFLRALRELGNVTLACEELKINRASVYRWKDADSAFEQAWLEALPRGQANYGDVLERELFRRALESSDTCLIFALKGAMPHKYRERVSNEHTGANGGPIVLASGQAEARELSESELDALVSKALKQLRADSVPQLEQKSD